MSEQDFKIDGETFEVWAKKLFEFELCGECGLDWDAHTPNIVLGNWFARCKNDNS